MVGETPAPAAPAMPSRPGTSRWVNVIVPTFAGGIRRPRAARGAAGAAKAETGTTEARAAAAAAPAPVCRSRRRLRVGLRPMGRVLRAP